MVFFIVVLRALAACLITNSHYSGIYPISELGSGGLLGDILFFAISGWCLYNVRGSFPRWYGKRLARVYPPVFIITAAYLLLGFLSLAVLSPFELFIFPTSYHFVASILLLYIPYYVVMKVDFLRKRIPLVMAVLAAIHLIVYIFFYNRTYHHIDIVEEPMIRFLFMQSMLLGAWFRQNDQKFRNRICRWDFPAVVLLLAAHLVYKLCLADAQSLLDFQFINQLILFALLYFLLRLFAGLDSKLEALPGVVRKSIGFISNLTLEIYLVQYVLIFLLTDCFPFPLNWLVVTAAIILEAYLLHKIWELIRHGFQKLFLAKNKRAQ